MNSNKNHLGDYLKLVAPIIIVFGVIKLSIFYSEFNLNIFNYLDFDEILTSSLSDAIYFGIILFLGFYFGIVSHNENESNKHRKFEKAYMESNSLKRVLSFLANSSQIPFIILFLVNLIIFYFITKFNILIDALKYFIYFFLAFLFLDYMCLEAERNIRNKVSKDIPHSLFINIYIFGTFLIYTVLIAKMEAFTIKKLKYNNEIKFKINNELIESNKIHYYIGQTRNYLFYYLEDKSETIVYPIKKLEMLSFKKKKENR